jgi:hypothetical protein
MAHDSAPNGRIRTAPFAAHGAALHGRVRAAPHDARIRVSSGNRSLDLCVQDEHWGCFGLPPGRYRVEYVSTRMILSREVVLDDAREVQLDFDLRDH